MGTEEKVIDALRKLPPERQTEVLDFVEFLRARLSRQASGKTYDLAERENQEDLGAPQPCDGGAFPRTTLEAPDTPPFIAVDP